MVRRARGSDRFPSRRSTAIAFSTLIAVTLVPPLDAGPPPRCSDPGTGWCVARRFAGTIPGGELGFRFGEPLDVDGDGSSDLAAGARFKKDGVYEAGVAGVWSGATGRAIRTWDGPAESGLFGHTVLPVPDLDGDGLADVVIAAPNAHRDGVMQGVVTARSPKTGAEIWRRFGSPGSQFGWDLAIASDRTHDGRVDLFIGAPGVPGRVDLVNGKDGAVVRTFAPRPARTSFGWYVARVDDLDADGAPDLAVGAPPGYTADDPPNGAAYVFSSGSGRELHHWDGTAPGAGFGEMVAALGDLDGDGHGEIVVSAPGSNEQSRSLVGEVRVYSGTSGAELRRWHGTAKGDLYGRMIVGAGDIDGDGIEDLAIGAPWHRRGADDRVGAVELRSGRNGSVVAVLEGDAAESWFGWHIRRAPDPDGRGRLALLIGSVRASVDGVAGVGAVDLWVLRRPGATVTESTNAAPGGATSNTR